MMWREIWRKHRGKITGGSAGFLFGLLVMWIGVLWALFIGACTFTGYLVGRQTDDGGEDWESLLERIMPRGRKP
ncbi:MAG: DUF2273 domain-containing protein [Thermaerobacterales bacterium]